MRSVNILPQLGLPFLRLPWTSFPSSSTHQQYPDVMWHCTAMYPPSSLHSGTCKPTTGTPLSPRAWRLWIWQGLSHATKENNHTIEKKRTIIYTVKPRFKDTRLIRTPQYHGQFALSLGNESTNIFSKYNSPNTDTLSDPLRVRTNRI